MAVEVEWIEHRRGDGELVGWIVPAGEGFTTVDLLGRVDADEVSWDLAEERLEERGLAYLADKYELLLETGEWLGVVITEVSPDGIRVKQDDFGAVGMPDQQHFEVPFPVPDTLRAVRR